MTGEHSEASEEDAQKCASSFVGRKGAVLVTKPRLIGPEEPFRRWMRTRLLDSKRGLSVTDLDAVLFNYLNGRLCLVECKSHMANVPFSQRDTLSILDQFLRLGAGTGVAVSTARGKRRVTYEGLHMLRVSGSCPDNSQVVLLDGRPVSPEELIQVLNMEGGATGDHRDLA